MRRYESLQLVEAAKRSRCAYALISLEFVRPRFNGTLGDVRRRLTHDTFNESPKWAIMVRTSGGVETPSIFLD